MDYCFWDKIRMWLCKKLGHKHKLEKAWEYSSKIHCPCERCCYIISVDKKK